jgi:hypothetical protein
MVVMALVVLPVEILFSITAMILVSIVGRVGHIPIQLIRQRQVFLINIVHTRVVDFVVLVIMV